MPTLSNEFTRIEYREEKKEIFGQDLTDHYNDPAFYNRTVRGIKKAWDRLEREFHGAMKMRDVMQVMDECGIKTHYWCMMD